MLNVGNYIINDDSIKYIMYQFPWSSKIVYNDSTKLVLWGIEVEEIQQAIRLEEERQIELQNKINKNTNLKIIK